VLFRIQISNAINNKKGDVYTLDTGLGGVLLSITGLSSPRRERGKSTTQAQNFLFLNFQKFVNFPGQFVLSPPAAAKQSINPVWLCNL
jgi:hypothetical protein